MRCGKCGYEISTTSGICAICVQGELMMNRECSEKEKGPNKIDKLEHDLEMLSNRLQKIEDLLDL